MTSIGSGADFTSALYLGMRHGSSSLRAWTQLTIGMPAALATPVKYRQTAQALARLQGCEHSMLAPSTLHLFVDLSGIFGRGRILIYMDSGLYPVGRWSVERMAVSGMAARTFRHYDPNSLAAVLKKHFGQGLRPVVVTDGFCPRCGSPLPIKEYLDCLRRYEGLLIIDDTQALGVLGHSSSPYAPYGRGGGGILRWRDVSDPNVLLVCSLAKGFGVPLAALSGSREMVRLFLGKSKTRVHCSPPSVAAVHAADHALELNARHGDRLRLRLAELVRHFRGRLRAAGLSTMGGLFPVQTLVPLQGLDVTDVHAGLRKNGVRAVLTRGPMDNPRLRFMITARHTLGDVDNAAMSLTREVSMRISGLGAQGWVSGNALRKGLLPRPNPDTWIKNRSNVH